MALLYQHCSTAYSKQITYELVFNRKNSNFKIWFSLCACDCLKQFLIKLERKNPKCLMLSVNNTKNEFENEQFFKSYLHVLLVRKYRTLWSQTVLELKAVFHEKIKTNIHWFQSMHLKNMSNIFNKTVLYSSFEFGKFVGSLSSQ